MQAIQFNSSGKRTNWLVDHYTGGHGMSFCLEDQKPQLPEPPSPLLGLFFWAGRDLGEQFCTDGFCQGVQARMSGGSMSETDQFWQYAREAMLLACDAKTRKDKQDLLELAGTWTQAALQSRPRPLGAISAA
jgi:hypothetical protein